MNTKQISHSELVKALVKPGQQIRDELTAADANLLHMAVGICGEAGELIDAVKKRVIYRKELDRANVIEELGDLEFYMEGMRQELAISREETLAANIAKLSKRYEDLKYTDKKAAERADKLIVHYLRGGIAPCGIQGVPKDWPINNKWSAFWIDVTCPDCLARMPKGEPDHIILVNKVERPRNRTLPVDE